MVCQATLSIVEACGSLTASSSLQLGNTKSVIITSARLFSSGSAAKMCKRAVPKGHITLNSTFRVVKVLDRGQRL